MTVSSELPELLRPDVAFTGQKNMIFAFSLEKRTVVTVLGCLGWFLAGQFQAFAQEKHAVTGAAGRATADGPIGVIHAHVCGFHFYSGDPRRAVRADHYCSHLNAEVYQCIIYDSDQPNARLIGIEYIISEALFNGLPDEEKKLWHSRRYEITSGLLTVSAASGVAEQKLVSELVNSYGKTWHFWQVDRGDALPMGLPRLMMGFTADGQIDPALVAARDRERKVDTAKIKTQRAVLKARPIAAGADGWMHGPAWQLEEQSLKNTGAGREP